MRVFWAWVVFALFLFLAAVLHGDEKKAQLTVRPRIALAGMKRASIWVQLRVPRHKDNRWWSISYSNEDGVGGTSGGQIDGEESPAIFPVCTEHNLRPCVRELGVGNYTFVGCVQREEGRKINKYCDNTKVEVK